MKSEIRAISKLENPYDDEKSENLIDSSREFKIVPPKLQTFYSKSSYVE